MNEITPQSPSPTITASESPAGLAFADYFKKREGFSPNWKDERVKMLFSYYLVGSLDTQSGRIPSQPLADAMVAWCTITAIIAEMRQRTMRLVAGALNPAHKSRSNPRLLVFQDALEDLAELLDRELPLHPEAVEWWHNRRSTLMPDADEMRADLRRLDRLVEQIEAEAGMNSETPDDVAAPTLRAIDKIEGIVSGLRDVASCLQNTVHTQRERIVHLQHLNAQRN